MGIGPDRLEILQDLTALLDQGILTEADADGMLELLTRLFSLRSLVVSHDFSYAGWSKASGDFGRFAEDHVEVEAHDPSGPYLRRAPLGSWYIVSRAPEHTHHSPVHDLFVRERFADSAITRLPGIGPNKVTMALLRGQDVGAFDDDDAFLFSLLYPRLAGALSTRSAHAALSEAPSTGLRGCDGWAFVHYPEPDVRWSRPARALFSKKLGPIGPRGWSKLNRAVTRAAAEYYGPGVCGGRQRITADIEVEFAHVRTAPKRTRTLVALFYDRRRAGPPAHAGAITAAEELLSARQREVARRAARDWPVTRISENLGIGVETVRRHLRDVYRRLNCSTRTELRDLVA